MLAVTAKNSPADRESRERAKRHFSDENMAPSFEEAVLLVGAWDDVEWEMLSDVESDLAAWGDAEREMVSDMESDLAWGDMESESEAAFRLGT